jgi:hypothetical protein
MGFGESKSKMKKLGTFSTLTVYEVGDLFYVLVPEGNVDRLIITAHGGHALLSGTNKFTVPRGLTLKFYSDDTKSVIDPGFNQFYQYEAVPREVIDQGNSCYDYILTKYQGRHGSKDETYQSIARTIDGNVQGRRNYQLMAQRQPQNSSKYLAKSMSYPTPAVLTVRNRWFKGDATLSMALDAALSVARGIAVVECLFCRSTLFGGSQAVVWAN